MTCGDAGFVKRDDLAVTHPLFGQAIPCPHCEGARKNRNLALEGLAFVQRDAARRGPVPDDPRGPLRPYTENLARRLLSDEEGAASLVKGTVGR